VNEADLERAKTKATDAAMRRAILMMLYTLVDKHQAPKEDIQQLAWEINYTAGSIKDGYVTWADIERVLLKEYEIEIKLI